LLLWTFKKVSIGDVEFLDKKETSYQAKDIKGIPLKSLFAGIDFAAKNHKELNSFFFVFSVTDGFKVVFSHNEILNQQGPGGFYFVTDYNDKSMRDSDERLLIISANTNRPGHKVIKGLNRIRVAEAE
jgi:hypothetical protein